jgi:putative transposase
LEISEKTFKRWIKIPVDQRFGPSTIPANKLSEIERQKVLNTANCEEYYDLPPCQIVPKLADKGEYIASESTFYRILKEEKLLTHRGKSKPASNNKPEPLVAIGPNQVYSWDITYLKSPITGMFYYLYMFIDVYSRKIVGHEVHENEDMEKSAKLITKIHKDENLVDGQVKVHSDNGAPMKGASMLATLQNLGIVPSFSRPRVSNDNPFSESLFKTLKYCPQYPTKPFNSLSDSREWVNDFVDWYNHRHLHSGIKFVTPADRHAGKDQQTLIKRKQIYEEAKKRNPNRWSGKTRNWDHIEKVELNGLQEDKILDIRIAS